MRCSRKKGLHICGFFRQNEFFLNKKAIAHCAMHSPILLIIEFKIKSKRYEADSRLLGRIYVMFY